MIPADVASRVQSAVDATVRPAAPAQEVSNVLSNLASGQRVLAEIQAQLPNGAYRAIINQRDITLALPFSAKAGDSLELEVVDNDGKLTLAVVSRRPASSEEGAKSEQPAVQTTLSRTGNFIAGLLGNREEGPAAKPVLLNANLPIAEAPPSKAADLVPLLKQAITQSGMFYESQQSQWLSNRVPLETLLSQPQGRHSQTLPGPSEPATVAGTVVAKTADAEAAPKLVQQANAASATETQAANRPAPAPGQIVAPDLVPLVQQQLEALANQNYVWQGLAWPGQPMQWEIIEENRGQQRQGNDSDQPPWQTRLILTMPELGEVRAALRIVGGELTLSLSVQSSEAANQLTDGSDTLRTQLEAAGLKLNGFTVGRHDRPTE